MKLCSESPAAPSDIRLLADASPASDGAAASSGTRLAISTAPLSDSISGAHADVALEAERPSDELRVEAQRLSDGPIIETEVAVDEGEPAELHASVPEESASELGGIASGRVWFYASVLVALGYCAQLALTW